VRLGAALGCAAVGATIANSAGAVEREQHLGIDLGGNTLVLGGSGADTGGSVGAHWIYGLTDQFDLMIEGAWSVEALGGHPGSLINAGAGVSYVLDVLQWVPYVGVLAAGYDLMGSKIGGPKLLPGGVLALGLDYRLNREVELGVAVRENMLLTEVSTYPSFVQVFARLEYTWGW
jgi:hypothetical protein